MTWTPTDEQRGVVEQALWNASYGWDIKDREGLVEKLADAALAAVGPDITANTYRSAARLARAYDADAQHAADIMDERADQIEKEAGR